MTYTATIYSYGFENQPDFTFTDNTFKSIWNTVIKTIKDCAHNDAAYDGWRVKFEKDGTALPIYIRVRCIADTRWTDIFATANGKTHYITSTLAQY